MPYRRTPRARALRLAAPLLAALAAGPAAGQESVPYVATPEALVDAMLALGEVRPGDVVYDLGSGDGRIVIAAAERFGTRGLGYEHDPGLVALSRRSAAEAGVADRVRFLAEDLFEADLREATVVMIYLGPDFNLRLRPRLLEQLRPGARVVSHAFHMGDWAPDSTVTLGRGAGRATLYRWVVPARVDGFWNLAVGAGEERWALELRQRFQRLEGEARGGGAPLPLSGGALRGEAVEFDLTRREGGREVVLRFRGRVQDGRMSGEVTGPGSFGRRGWSAERFTAPPG